MSASALALFSAPASLAVAALVLRHGPSAVVTLVAGVVAVLAPGKRGDRALAVLRLLRAAPKATRCRERGEPPGHPGGQQRRVRPGSARLDPAPQHQAR